MTKLRHYIAEIHKHFAQHPDWQDQSSLLGTQLRYGDFEAARYTYQSIEDPDDRAHALGDAVRYEDKHLWAMVQPLLQDETLTDTHADILPDVLEDPNTPVALIEQLLSQTADDAVGMQASCWTAIAQAGKPEGAEAFFQENAPSWIPETVWRIDLAKGCAANGDWDGCLDHLAKSDTYHVANALADLSDRSMDQAMLDTQVDKLIPEILANDDGSKRSRELDTLIVVPGQWPRLANVYDQTRRADDKFAQVAKFQAIYLNEGADPAWDLAKTIDDDALINGTLSLGRQVGDVVLEQAIAEFTDVTHQNHMGGVLVMNAIAAGHLDRALHWCQQIVPVNDPENSMQPQYRKNHRHHLLEALFKAGQLDDMITLFDSYEPNMGQTYCAYTIVMLALRQGRTDDAHQWADRFHSAFAALPKDDRNWFYELPKQAAVCMAMGDFRQAKRLQSQSDKWNRSWFLADVVTDAARSGQHLDQMEQVVLDVWGKTSWFKKERDVLLQLAVVEACYAIEQALSDGADTA